MGLDMYLTGKRYLSHFFSEGDAEKQNSIQIMFPELTNIESNFGGSAVKEISVEVGYWRKANAIHDWFVKNVQNGEDECRPHYVNRDQLAELKTACEQVLKEPSSAAKILPTAKGFFFGDTSYGEHYMDDINLTIAIIDRCLNLPEVWEFEYRSSW